MHICSLDFILYCYDGMVKCIGADISLLFFGKLKDIIQRQLLHWTRTDIIIVYHHYCQALFKFLIRKDPIMISVCFLHPKINLDKKEIKKSIYILNNKYIKNWPTLLYGNAHLVNPESLLKKSSCSLGILLKVFTFIFF